MDIVITGASSGIGAATAVRLTAEGHRVLVLGRSAEKLSTVRRRMLQAAPSGSDVPEPLAVDFASLDAVRAAAAQILLACPRLDALVNNAGLQTSRRRESADGYELVFAVNHLAPFLLTNLLLERIRSSGGRVVTTASSSHVKGRLDFDDLQMRRKWRGARAYGTSKLSNILFAAELRRRCGVPSTALHPGGVTTDLNRDSPYVRFVKPFEKYFLDEPEQAADALAWLAAGQDAEATAELYYVGRTPRAPSPQARDAALAARLWDASARLTGIHTAPRPLVDSTEAP